MDLFFFPVDTQTCNLVFVPLIYEQNEVQLKWRTNNPIIIDQFKNAEKDDASAPDHGFSLKSNKTEKDGNFTYQQNDMNLTFSYIVGKLVNFQKRLCNSS